MNYIDELFDCVKSMNVDELLDCIKSAISEDGITDEVLADLKEVVVRFIYESDDVRRCACDVMEQILLEERNCHDRLNMKPSALLNDIYENWVNLRSMVANELADITISLNDEKTIQYIKENVLAEPDEKQKAVEEQSAEVNYTTEQRDFIGKYKEDITDINMFLRNLSECDSGVKFTTLVRGAYEERGVRIYYTLKDFVEDVLYAFPELRKISGCNYENVIKRKNKKGRLNLRRR